VKLLGASGQGHGVSVTLRLSVALAAALAVGMLMPLGAQGLPGAPASTSSAQIAARQQIAAFEGALENAVRYGEQKLIQHASVTPAATTRFEVLLTGQARARGFRLDGYGAVFDVEFPSIRRSVAWTMSTLERPDPELLAAMKELRKKSDADPQSRQEMDRLIREMEDQIQAYNARAKSFSNATIASAQSVQGPAAPVPVDDPRTFYAAELTNALMTAVLDQGSAIGISPNEWLTVAARESLDFRFVPDDPATTLIMRVKGSDLTALRDKRLTPDEARKRIEVKQY